MQVRGTNPAMHSGMKQTMTGQMAMRPAAKAMPHPKAGKAGGKSGGKSGGRCK
jgi:hypothetical protein